MLLAIGVDKKENFWIDNWGNLFAVARVVQQVTER